MAKPANYDLVAIDLVGYSKLSSDEQVTAVERLNRAVKECINVLGKTADFNKKNAECNKKKFVYLPTGDGMFIGFLTGDLSISFKLAKRLHARHYRGKERNQLKIALWRGVVFPIKDINDMPNFAGAGINGAARLESCCSPGHILVASDIIDAVMEMSEKWQKRELGCVFRTSDRVGFRVKWDQGFDAFNYFGRDFGNSDGPEKNRAWDGTYTRLVDRLGQYGIGPTGVLAEQPMRKAYDGRLVVGEVVVDDLVHYQGITPDRVEVFSEGSIDPLLPPFVLHRRRSMKPVKPNRPKVHLVAYEKPTIDKGDILKLTVRSSDYQTSMAILKNERQIIEELRTLPDRFPGRFNLEVVIVSADNKLMLFKRSENMDYYPGMWSVLGETLDRRKDWDATTRAPSPIRAVLRSLRDHDEANLNSSLRDREVDVRFLGIATLCRYLLRDLIVFAKLKRITANQIKDRFGAESSRVDAVEFSIHSCLEVVKRQRHSIPGVPDSDAEIADFGMASILAALFHAYGYDTVAQRI